MNANTNDPNIKKVIRKKLLSRGRVVKMVEIPPLESIKNQNTNIDGFKSKKNNK